MMLQETLLAMRDSLEKLNSEKMFVTNEEIENIVEYFKNISKGSFIFPMKFMEEVRISIDKVYNILTILEDSKFIEPIFQVYCHECDNFQKGYYLTLLDIPDEELCEFCNESLGKKNIMVRYRVIMD